MSRAYLCVSVDVDSDQERGAVVRHPPSFDGVTDGVVARLHPLFERFGAKPTYLLSPEVMLEPRCLEIFRRLAPSSELGTRLTVQRPERSSLTDVTDLFIRAFDHQPQSFRAGSAGFDAASIEVLVSLGYAVDSSVSPALSSRDAALSQPYSPDLADPQRAGETALLEVPITRARRFLNRVPVVGARIEARSLCLSRSRASASALVRVAEDELAAARRRAPERPVILHATLANVDVVPSASPRGADEEGARGIVDAVRALLTFARRDAIAVIGLADVPAVLARARP